jgi:hypothetical protein
MSTDNIIDAIAEVEASPKVKMGRNRSYTQVADRVVAFRRNFAPEDWGIVTNVTEDNGEVIKVSAAVVYYAGDEDRVISTGHAEEVRGSSNINKTSALENAETSAIGRALAGMALHGGEFASAGEVQEAIHEQEKPTITEGQRDALLQLLKDGGLTPEQVREYRETLRVADWMDLTVERFDRLYSKMESKLAREYAEGEAATANGRDA